MSLLFPLARRLLFSMDAERAHDLTVRALSSPALARLAAVQVPDMPVEIAGLRLPNPVGLAAGLDKNAVAVDGLLALGFGFVDLSSRERAEEARDHLGFTLQQVEKAFDFLQEEEKDPLAKRRLAAALSQPPAHLQKQIASYQAALFRLTGQG